MGRPSAPALTTRKAMQSPLSTAFTVVFCICVGFFAVEKGTMLYEEYVMQALIIRKDLDFLKKCKTAEGYASMNHHPNFCEKIIATAEVGAFWHAVRRVSGSLPFEEMMGVFQRLSWQFMAVLAVLTLVFPSLIISQWRSRQDCAHRGYQDDYKRMV